MRGTVSFPASPAPHRAKTLGVPKADRNGSGEIGSARRTDAAAAAVEAAVAPPYRGESQGKTRPDSSRRQMGPSLIPEKNVAEERPLSLPSFCPSHIVSLPVSLLSALLPAVTPSRKGMEEGGSFFLEADLRI